MRSRAWMIVCVLLALGCGGGHKPETDNGPDRPFPFLGGDEDDGTASLDGPDGGPEQDGGPDMVQPDSGPDTSLAGSAGSDDGGTGGTAGATGGAGGTAGSAGGEAGGGASGAGPDAGMDDAGTAFVPSTDALPGTWSTQYKVVTCAEDVTSELMAGCDTPSACAPTTLTIDADLNVTSSDLVSMALGSSWANDTLTQTQKDNLGTDSELTLWFVDSSRILGRLWSAGSPFTGGFEICRGLRATRQ